MSKTKPKLSELLELQERVQGLLPRIENSIKRGAIINGDLVGVTKAMSPDEVVACHAGFNSALVLVYTAIEQALNPPAAPAVAPVPKE